MRNDDCLTGCGDMGSREKWLEGNVKDASEMSDSHTNGWECYLLSGVNSLCVCVGGFFLFFFQENIYL